MKTISRIKRIAHNVRRAMEAMADEEGYCPDLACMCAIASGELWRRLKRAKIPARLVLCSDCFWAHVVVYSSGYYIDITATQFTDDHEKVTIMTAREFKEKGHWYWQPKLRFRSDTELQAFQQKTQWPEEQMCIQRG